ncbi:MAG: CocE/NonD family hydrolase [Pseudomonadales bacterium]
MTQSEFRNRTYAAGRTVLLTTAFVIAAVVSGLSRAEAANEEEDAARARAEYIRANYAKFEYRIPMRDGARLFTSVYVPNDRSKTYPILLLRTPYTVAPYGLDRYKDALGPTEAFEKEGFIFVFQDVRGRFMSEGEFVNMRPHIDRKSGDQVDESSDTYDTIDWLVKELPANNGKVGQWGISYPGFYTSAGAIDSHPALKAVSPQAPIADWFWDDMHHNGAFILPLTFNFFSTFGQARPEPTTKWPDQFEHGTPDGYEFFLDLGPVKNANERYLKGEIEFWNQLTQHPNYDAFWQSRNILPHLKNIRAAVLVVGGWFDTEDLYGPLNTYAAIERQNPRTENRLVMGPWSHGQWAREPKSHGLGSADFGFATPDYYNEKILLPFFLHHLKGGDAPDISEATVFETGANRWRHFDAWPPEGVEQRRLSLRAEGGLAFEPPAAAEGYDEYVSDPAKPVPYTAEISTGWSKNYMTEDQRFTASRPDVLVYRSQPLTEDLTLAGPLTAELFVSTDGSAADWIVKVIDVWPGELPGQINRDDEKEAAKSYPGGRQQLVRAEVMRGRFRDSFETPKPFEPDRVTPVQFRLNDTFHTFKRGHRLMVQIQSTWFPFVDRNPQTYVPNIFEAEAADFRKATHRVYRSEDYPSAVRVGVLP